jgi:tripartite-type tricarboxylate transporter receptor subunit TctC
MAGQVQLMFAPMVGAQVQVRAGKLRALAVTSAKRLPTMPDVPTIAEVLPGFESSAWFGLFAPPRMAPDLTRRMNEAARQAIASPDVRKRLESEGLQMAGNSPEEFAAFVQSEIKRWGEVVKYSGAKPE